MNIRNELLKEHSKKQQLKMARYIGNDKVKFKELMGNFLSDDHRITQRAACVMNLVVGDFPSLIRPYLKKSIDLLDKPVHVAIKRNLLRIMQTTVIPENLRGKTVDSCYMLINSANESLAVKVFSITVILNITKYHPELKNELKDTVIELMKKDHSPAIQARGRNTLKALGKIHFAG